MPGKRRPLTGRKLRGGSDTRQLVNVIMAAGVPREDIEVNAQGHLVVPCPDGEFVVIGSSLKTAGSYAAARRDLAEHGVLIPARGGGGNRGNRQRNRQPRNGTRYSAVVTRCADGETYALATADDGVTWFISRWSLSRTAKPELAEGRRVTFTGDPLPGFGKQYPDAHDVQVMPGREEEPHGHVAGEPAPGAGTAQRGAWPDGDPGNLPVLPAPRPRHTPAVAAALEAAAAVKYAPLNTADALRALAGTLKDGLL